MCPTQHACTMLSDLIENWPLPLKALTACLHKDGPDPGVLQRMTAADWDRFQDLTIRQHRVAPLVAQALARLEIPDTVRLRLNDVTRLNAMATLTQISETRRIYAALDAEGITPIVFKGWPLAAALYGDASLRHTGDLDLLVPRDQAWKASLTLETISYQLSETTAKMRRRTRGRGGDRLLATVKDLELLNPRAGVSIELHWQLLNYRGWPDMLDQPGAVTGQDSQAGPLQVLGPEANLMYLSTHGALHLWHRLKWLTDIAWLARTRGAATLEADYRTACDMGLGRPVAMALRLARCLLGSPVPAEVADARDPRLMGLERWILNRLGTQDGPWQQIRYQMGIRRMALGLAENWRQKQGVIGYDTTRRLNLIALDLTLPKTR